jgi:hypothetical protein
MANEIVTLLFDRRAKGGATWSGIFLYPISPVIETWDNALVIPSPSSELPPEVVLYDLFDPVTELAKFDDGTLYWINSGGIILGDDALADPVEAMRIVRNKYDKLNPVSAARQRFSQFGRRLDAVP